MPTCNLVKKNLINYTQIIYIPIKLWATKSLEMQKLDAGREWMWEYGWGGVECWSGVEAECEGVQEA